MCIRCGKSPHPRDACPAKDITCRRCQKIGHFAAMCRTKTPWALHSVEQLQDSPALDSSYVDTILDAQDATFWTTDVLVNNTTVTFISEDTLKFWAPQRSLYTKQETLWFKWTTSELNWKPYSDDVLEAEQIPARHICDQTPET